MSTIEIIPDAELLAEPSGPDVDSPPGQEIPTLLPLQHAPRFYINQPPRPILSRDASSLFWMSRYIERAEHIARILLVDSGLLMDVGDLVPRLQQEQWLSIPRIMRVDDPPPDGRTLGQRIGRYMTFDADNPSSIVSCITRARENARGVRESISAEMWENLNVLYWSLTSEEAPERFDESPEGIYRQVMTGSMLFQGITDQTLGRDQRWLFTRLGKYIERIEVTCRIIETKYELLRAEERALETPLRNINWMAVLRTCCSIEAYRRNYLGDMDPLRVACFLVLEKSLPRSVRFCVGQTYETMAAIRAEVSPGRIEPAERILGRLDAQLEYAEVDEILEQGLTFYLRDIQSRTVAAALAIQNTYFLQ